MMREIKFRAWDKVEEKMRNVSLMDKCNRNNSKYQTLWFYGLDSARDYADIEDCILEQYTGLKDKNGEEIYEGDTLEDCGETDCFGHCYLAFPSVRWNKLKGCYVCRYPDGEELLLSDVCPEKYCKVIGNIHENPELVG